MNCFKLTVTLLLLLPYAAHSMESVNKPITYQRPSENDVASITHLINTQAIHDSTKIVILPEKFRERAIQGSLSRLFIARHEGTNDIAGFKKLFIIDNQNEYNDIMRDEIRCADLQNFVNATTISIADALKTPLNKEKIIALSYENSITIYTGGDFTAPDYRGKRINSDLTHYAFNQIAPEVQQMLQGKRIAYIVLLYGLTRANAGEGAGAVDRSPSILKLFNAFIKTVTSENILNDFHHYSYQAFMPTFDPQDAECKPLPDDQSVEGYGNVLIYPLSREQ